MSCVCYVLYASVYMCFVVTCWERADLLALVCGVFCEFVTFPLVSWVRCGTWLYRFLIFATLLTLMIIYTMEVTFLKCQILMFFSVLECKKRKSRSHGKRKNGNIKRKICTEKRLNSSLKDLSLALTNHGQHGLFSFLSSLPISVLRNLELEALR